MNLMEKQFSLNRAASQKQFPISNHQFIVSAALILQLILRGQVHTSAATPNDPEFQKQWYLQKIQAPQAWEVTTGSREVVVAVFDRGIPPHPDLEANVWVNTAEVPDNGVDDDNNGYVDDVNGIGDRTVSPENFHGLACAGIIGAIGNNGLGVTGVNWNVKIMLVGIDFTIESIISGLDYVIQMKQRGINIRATSHSYNLNPAALYSPLLREALERAGEEGILNVFSAGNSSWNLDGMHWYPARLSVPSMLVVAATDANEQFTFSPNYGPESVHLSAPGDRIFTTYYGYDARLQPFPGYTYFGATSSAAPMVAAAVALLASARPDLGMIEIKAAILGSVDAAPSLRARLRTNGRLNLGRAMEMLGDGMAPAIVVHASPSGLRSGETEPLMIAFNKPMDRGSVEASFVIDPSVEGRFEWSPDSRMLTFLPAGTLNPRNTYLVRISGGAKDSQGRTLDGNYNRIHEGAGLDDFSWTIRFPVPGDDFLDPLLLSGTSGSLSGDSRRASMELHEPNVLEGRTVWHRWTAQGDQFMTFEGKSGIQSDAKIAVYQGPSLQKLELIVQRGEDGSGPVSKVSFHARAGETYSICFDQDVSQDRPAPYTLTWNPTPPPSFSSTQFSPIKGLPGTKVTITGTNLIGVSEVLFNGASAVFTHAEGSTGDSRLNAIVPVSAVSGPVTLVAPYGRVTSIRAFEVSMPRLTVQKVGEIVEVGWASSSPEFVLESSENLLEWNLVTNGVLREDSGSIYSPDLGSTACFYRILRQKVN